MRDEDAARALLSARAVRERARQMLRLCQDDRLAHWRLDRSKLPDVADFTLSVMRDNYPDLDIPFHARWRHFAAGGRDRWSSIAARGAWKDAAARARAEFDLAIVSVLLDAGAGGRWRYREADGALSSRSEGLAIASLDMFAAGLFSADASDPLRADAERLATIDARALATGFQVHCDNPLVGLAGRVDLLNRLGRACLAAPDVFARNDGARPGGLFGVLAAPSLPADAILAAVLAHLGPIWPSRLSLAGVALGDTWRHPQIRADDATDGLIPFHKLSQWLSYSLIEPLQRAGVEVVDIDGLTGLPEYRNGGLFVDFGALAPKNVEAARAQQTVDSLFVVEWRALTVALLDEIAGLVRAKLNLTAAQLPLARVLEGGTWAAGRRIAAQSRADGSPPLDIVSDGTVF
ncbi:MAG: URC4/urg3 family protein [Methylobacteriaceae bacterium]|nr:URC4/urg3 family protein [Methylobacteriaceae bacterium]